MEFEYSNLFVSLLSRSDAYLHTARSHFKVVFRVFCDFSWNGTDFVQGDDVADLKLHTSKYAVLGGSHIYYVTAAAITLGSVVSLPPRAAQQPLAVRDGGQEAAGGAIAELDAEPPGLPGPEQ